VVIIGAGIGGLACAIALAARGLGVTVVERAPCAGGKMRQTDVGGQPIDSGPTVFTMRWVFQALFEAAGARFEDYVSLQKLDVLARHAWSENERFDLFADIAQAADAVGEFSGPQEARRFLAFCAEARSIFQTLKGSFIAAPRPNPFSLSTRIGLHRPGLLLGIRPFSSFWNALSGHFHDPRLRQLFGRYATYNGSSPFLSPATLMLIAHVEQDGVWTIRGGMQCLAQAMEKLARSKGVEFRFGAEANEVVLQRGRAAGVMLATKELLAGDAVVVNADISALGHGLLGDGVASAVPPVAAKDRSLSAVTWAMTAQTSGFSLLRHNVFFSKDYRAEFDQIFAKARLPDAPTVYICAQDRDAAVPAPPTERLLLLVNAPAVGDRRNFAPEEIATCQTRVLALLERCGLSIRPRAVSVTTPWDFHRLFPASGGALYGRAAHGWMASFRRPGSATKIPGLYLAGGSTHPGAGVPMAALSGQLAAQRLISDRLSMPKSRRVAIYGGISTPPAATDVMRSP
jgi:1-hydroxycarotenoid 3,4-desaturase